MIEEVAVGKSQICQVVLDDLPEWFGLKDAKAMYVAAVADMSMIVAREASETFGFVAIKDHNAFTAELYVMGVKRDWHGKGTGKSLVDASIKLAYQKGLRFLTVKTVAATSPDPNYAATRRFYERNGFAPLEIFPTLWSQCNPCLFMVRAVSVV